MNLSPDSIALIAARPGSKCVPGKNIKPLAGHPLIAYTMTAARASGIFSDIIVSTDSEEYAAIARTYGVVVPFLRPAEIAEEFSPDIEWGDYTLTQLRAQGRAMQNRNHQSV